MSDETKRVAHLESPRYALIAFTPTTTRKMFQIIFSKKDGSIFVMVPYFRASNGFLCESTRVSGGPDAPVMDYTARSAETRRSVKLSLHTSGRSHFSAVGMRTRIFRTTTPLANLVGPLFSVQVHGLEAFDEFAEADRKDKSGRFLIGARIPSPVETIMFNASWYPKDLLLKTAPDEGLGWLVRFRRGDDWTNGAIIGAPKGWPLDDHVILLSHELPDLGSMAPHYLLTGGFDPVEVFRDPTAPCSHLLAAYPRDVMADLPHTLPSYDLPDPVDVEVVGKVEA